MWQQQLIPGVFWKEAKRQVGSGHELGLWRVTLYLFPLFSKVWKHKAQAAAGSDYVLRYPWCHESGRDPRGG